MGLTQKLLSLLNPFRHKHLLQTCKLFLLVLKLITPPHKRETVRQPS